MTKKFTLNGFELTELVWIKPAEGRHKYEVLVRYIDPEEKRTKRADGARQKVIKFGNKGQIDYVDCGLLHIRDKINQRLKLNKENPLHVNFYITHILNG